MTLDSRLLISIVGFKYFGFSQEPPEGKKFDHYCGDDVYVKTTEKYESDSSLEIFGKMFSKNLRMVILKLQNLQIKSLEKFWQAS